MSKEICDKKAMGSGAQEHGIEGNFVIVIGRQFGSGGRAVGKLIASRLNIGFYDTELLKKAAESEGIDPKIFEEHEEKKPNILKHLLQGAYGIADNFHPLPLSSERIYNLQSKLIRDICEKQSCVIVGRNADFILKEHPRMLSVFLHAPVNHRVERILKRHEAVNQEAAGSLARQHDKRRELYYNYYTGDKKWGLAENYHLSIDTSILDNEQTASLIIETAKKKFSRNEVCRSASSGEESPGNKGQYTF